MNICMEETNTTNKRKTLSVADIMNLTGLTERTVRNLIRDGYIKRLPGLSNIEVTLEALDQYLSSSVETGAA